MTADQGHRISFAPFALQRSMQILISSSQTSQTSFAIFSSKRLELSEKLLIFVASKRQYVKLKHFDYGKLKTAKC